MKRGIMACLICWNEAPNTSLRGTLKTSCPRRCPRSDLEEAGIGLNKIFTASKPEGGRTESQAVGYH